jgi:WD40 repeat protein
VEAESDGVAREEVTLTCDVAVEKAHQADVNCVRWNPVRPGVLASAGDDQVVKVWAYSRFE